MPHFEDFFLAGAITLILITITKLNTLGDALGSLFSSRQSKD
jgi:Flp pilus assembly pilin Flp